MGNAWREAMARAAARRRARMARASGGKVGVWWRRLCIAKSARRRFFRDDLRCASESGERGALPPGRLGSEKSTMYAYCVYLL